ncbi:MAG: uroporphyrinogen-III synthase [Acidimicrobiales bacterium]
MIGEPNVRGCTVGITADRRGKDQAVMWRRLGAEVIHGAALDTVAAPNLEELRAHTDELIATPPDYLIANTGLGVRTWLDHASEWGVREALCTSLGQARVAARGPKAAGAVRGAGLALWWRSPDEQLHSVTEHLLEEGVSGRRVALQLHGEDCHEMTAALRGAGATVIELPVYRWTLPADRLPAQALIEACCAGEVDALTFTAGPAARNLAALADDMGRHGELLDVVNAQMVVGCVGPVCAGVAREEGFANPLVPEHWRLGAMVTKVAAALTAMT